MNVLDSSNQLFDAFVQQLVEGHYPAERAFGFVPLHVRPEARKHRHDPTERDLAVNILVQKTELVVAIRITSDTRISSRFIATDRESYGSFLNFVAEPQNLRGLLN